MKSYKVTVNKTVKTYVIRYNGIKRLPVDINKFVHNEVPIGVRDGVNVTFTSVFNFIPESLQVFINGIKQTIINDYQTIGTNIIVLNNSISEIENFNINYTKI